MKKYFLDSRSFVYASLLMLLVFLSAVPSVYTQEKGFEKTWGGEKYDTAWDVAVDENGNIYVVGETVSFGAGWYDTFILKYGSDGSLIWQKTWGGGEDERAMGVAVDQNGNIYVVGDTKSFGANDRDAFILKYGPDGTIIWQKTWGKDTWNWALGVAVDQNGNIHVVGYTETWLAKKTALILKYGSDGTLIWQKTWEGGGTDIAWDAAVDQNANIHVAGTTNIFGANLLDAFILKYGPGGSLIWQRTWGGTGRDEAYDVTIDENGNIYVVGDTDSFGAGDGDAFILKYGSDGSLIWQKTWGKEKWDRAMGVAVDQNGNIYIVGDTWSFVELRSVDVLILKYGSDGTLIWQKTWGGEEYDAAYGVSAGSVYVVGSTRSPSRTLNDVTGTETTPTGIQKNTTGIETTPAGQITTPLGTETTPSGEPSGGNGDAFMFQLPPIVETTDSIGTVKNMFWPGDDMYIKGSGYDPKETYDLYIVVDTDWYDVKSIPSRVSGTVWSVRTDKNGNIPNGTVAWEQPLTCGKYDIVIDVNGNGKYDAGIDALDDRDIKVTAGFFVIPELPLGTVTALLLMLAALVLFQRRPLIRKP